MFVPPGQGNAAHTHEVEEVFFILDGKVKVFFEDGAGRREETVLGRWDCVSAPAGVIHGFENVGLEPAYLQVMLGRARPDLMSYCGSGPPGPARRPPRPGPRVIARCPVAGLGRERDRRRRAARSTCGATASRWNAEAR